MVIDECPSIFWNFFEGQPCSRKSDAAALRSVVGTPGHLALPKLQARHLVKLRIRKRRMEVTIDTAFDAYSDTPVGRDPDSHSPTLRRYHQKLWSKPLPNGDRFTLSADKPKAYLRHNSALGEFSLSSDAIGHTYRYVKAMAPVIEQVPIEELEEFYSVCSTIGAYIVFPSQRIDAKPTINGARGMHWKIRDRFDLTLECIRRHYGSEESPLSETLERYRHFFDLFGSFEGYTQFFLLDDLVSPSGREVNFFIPLRGFDAPALPDRLEDYLAYKEALTNFVKARNLRIERWCATGV